MTPSTQHRDPIARALSLGTDGRSVKAWADVLSTVPLFTGLSQRHLRRVAGQATMKRYAPYTAIVRVDDPGDAFYVILDGSAAVRKPGKRSVKLRRGDFFGELALLDAAPRTATVEAESEVLTMRLGRTAFQKVLDSEPKVALTMVRALTPVVRAVRLVGRSRQLTWAQAAWAAYITAEQGLEIALVVFAYDHGGIAAAGLLAAARSADSAVTAPFTAGLGDRFDRRLVLVAAALLTSAVVACMSLAVAMAHGRWPVFVLAVVAAVVIPVYRPVQAALLPRLSDTPAQLTAANVIVSMLEGVGNLAGPALAGGLIVWAGAAPAFAALAALSFATALAVSRVPRTPAAALAAGVSRTRRLLAGFATVASNADVRVLMGTFGMSMVVWGAFFQVLGVAVAVERLGAAEGGAGLLASAAGIGAILGAIGSAGLVGRPRLVPAMAAGLIAWSAALVALAVTTATMVAYAMVIVTGTGLVLMDVVTFTLLQRAADDRLLARVFGVLESQMRAAIGLGALTVAALASVTSLSTTLVLVGALQPVGLLVAWRGLSRVDRLAAADPARIRLLRSVELFSFLPPADLERVAGHLQRVDGEAGEVLMRQGDRGDRVFLVDSGIVEVIRDGFHVTDMGAGSLVGEIALLRDVPRTATVRVADTAELYALERDEFLRIVTGDLTVAGQAGAIADARLSELGELQA